MGILLTTAEQAGSGSLLAMIAMYAVIIIAFYFIFMRPQKKEEKKLKAMIAAIEIGDYVLTTSGFYGTIIDITDDTVIEVEYGKDGKGIWKIEVTHRGNAEQKLTICNDEDAEIYSDIFEIDADFDKCTVI